MDWDPPLNNNMGDYELELPREAEIGAQAEVVEYDNEPISDEEEIIDNVDDGDPVEEYEEISVDSPHPGIDATPAPRVPDPENDSESLTSDNADDGPSTD